MLREVGSETRLVKVASDLEGLDGIVLPGGESTAQSKLLQLFCLMDPLREAISAGLPTLGTCAGLILLAKDVKGLIPGQQTLGLLDVLVERNSYGTQAESFHTKVSLQGQELEVAFIRAPRILDSRDTEVLARFEDSPVIVRFGSIFGATCHPEVTGDPGLHALFIEACRKKRW